MKYFLKEPLSLHDSRIENGLVYAQSQYMSIAATAVVNAAKVFLSDAAYNLGVGAVVCASIFCLTSVATKIIEASYQDTKENRK